MNKNFPRASWAKKKGSLFTRIIKSLYSLLIEQSNRKNDKTIRKLHKEMKCESHLSKRKLMLIIFIYKEMNAIVHTQNRFEFLARLVLT